TVAVRNAARVAAFFRSRSPLPGLTRGAPISNHPPMVSFCTDCKTTFSVAMARPVLLRVTSHADPHAADETCGRSRQPSLAVTARRTFHHRVVRPREPEPGIQRVFVSRVQHPPEIPPRTAIDHLAHQCTTQSVATVPGQHENVGEIRQRHTVRQCPCETDHPAPRVTTDHTPRA